MSKFFIAHLVSFTDTAPPLLYALSLHDALPISAGRRPRRPPPGCCRRWRPASGDRGRPVRGRPLRRGGGAGTAALVGSGDRKSTRLNSSHVRISYAVFCLKKKKCNVDCKGQSYK